jgi:hypothetical protein
MRTTYVMPVIVLLAAVSLTTRPSSSEGTTDECVGKPGATAPQGSHWYYRVNRADGRHCWYLGPEGARARPAMSAERTTRMPRRTVRRPAEATAAQTASPGPAPAQTASADPAPMHDPAPTHAAAADTTVGANDAAPEFASRWIDLPSALDASRRRQASMITNSYSEERAATVEQDGMPLVWPILTPAELAATAEPPPRSMVKWEYILGSLAFALALAAKVIGTVSGVSSAKSDTAPMSLRLTRLLRRAEIPLQPEGGLRRTMS